MYCPSAVAPEADPYTAYAYAAIDYFLLVGEPNRGPNGLKETIPNLYHSDRIRAEYKTRDKNGNITVSPSQRELVVDAMGHKGTSWDAATDNLKKAFTNHIAGGKAAGANIGFVDGHVAWRSRSDMEAAGVNRQPTDRFQAPFQGVNFAW
jgi:prepilin-type processing-associated H-X9-DG protein